MVKLHSPEGKAPSVFRYFNGNPMTLTARDVKALQRIAAQGHSVIVHGQGVRLVVEPVDAKPGDGVGSVGEARSAWDEWAAKKAAP